ncbi:MAG: SAM-dependent methyltransferase [Treponema sp.]|nr:SAM-dependent methyltransferase [Treponema sp.]
MTSITKLDGIGFLAFPEQKDFLISELNDRFNIDPRVKPEDDTTAPVSLSREPVSLSGLTRQSTLYGDLLYLPDKADFLNASGNHFPYWARTCMTEPFLLKFDSIGEAAAELKKIQRNWAPYQFTCFRRAGLIQEKLPYINLKDRKFPFKIPDSPMGLYTLIDEHTLIASAATTSPLPAGTLHFIEDHENPPSRAYLKIQESLTLADFYFGCGLPSPGQKCFEAGACPGGWTWVLAGLGAQVYAVDRAELAPELMKNPLVQFRAHDAFTIKPEEVGPVDWVFSDVICYPERLLEWIHVWLESGLTKHMICTIKMQGAIDWNLIRQFAAIPNSRILHLNYNKHELTFIHTST